MKTYHQVPSTEFLTHVKRELVHGVLRLMFGGQFSEAHEHGIITDCIDQIAHLWFPWLVCHSMDYPERFVFFPDPKKHGVNAPYLRVLMATMRYLADFPCLHCLVLKSQIGDLGLVADMKRHKNVRVYPIEAVKRARKRIFEKGGSVNYRGVEDQLTDTGSWVPTEVSSICVPPPTTPDDKLNRMPTTYH